ncbi:MAG: Gfo/Idh/MocA family oxidoreductase [Candidatus Electrothrix aestuarii]|uniref:Gfo/Idh/MocA family oxidoreductase n=1 Tax=Candidatus Electrothrix aestuarii TaxID=3062594 RepID=A0AAU8LUD4_9BACT|nr:Gfo/Idh/MocA family oxidoreductase [Candidatus Electrothrix aestuarii]
MSKEKLRVGVIGVGYLGRFHALKYAAMDDVQLVGVADADPERAQTVAEECGTKAFADYQPLLEHVDAVSIVVPTVYHHAVAIACLEHGVDILLEKPMTTTLQEADELIALADRKKLLLQVGHLERFNPAVLSMQPLLNNPLFIEAHRLSTFKNRGTDVDVILDLMIHDIDIILSIINSPIKDIHTVGAPVITQLTDIANARIVFKNGCTANITVSRISMENIRRMRIFQPGKYLSVDFGKKEVMAIKLKQSEQGSIPLPDVSRHGFSDQDVLEMEIREFINNIRHRRKPTVSGREGRRALAVALSVIGQIQENQKQFKHLLGTGGNFGLIDQP